MRWVGGGASGILDWQEKYESEVSAERFAPAGYFQGFLHLWVRGPCVWGSSGEEEDPSSGEEPACSSSSGE